MSQQTAPNQSTEFHLHIFLSIFLAVFLIVVLVFSTLRHPLRRGSASTTTSISTLTTPAPSPIPETKDVFTHSEAGIQFEYQRPVAVSLEEDSRIASLKISDGIHSIRLIAEPVEEQSHYQPTADSYDVTINGINWTYIDSSQYCDTGNCLILKPVLQTTRSDIRYQIILENASPEDTLVQNILYSLKLSPPSAQLLILPSKYQWSPPELVSLEAVYISNSQRNLFYQPVTLSGTRWMTTINNPEASWIKIEEYINTFITSQLFNDWQSSINANGTDILSLEADAPFGGTQGLSKFNNNQLQTVFWSVNESLTGDGCPSSSDTSTRTTSCPIEVVIFKSQPTNIQSLFSLLTKERD